MNIRRLAIGGFALSLAFLGACGSDDDTDNPSNNTGNVPVVTDSVPSSVTIGGSVTVATTG